MNAASGSTQKTKYRIFTRDKDFYKSLILLAIPISLQNLITFAVNFADNVMIGSLGDHAVSGVYICSQFQSVLQMLIGGVEGTLLILSAQYWGKRDKQSIKYISSIGMRFGLGVGFVMMAFGSLFPSQIMSLFTADAGVIAEGAVYLRIIAFTYLLFPVSQILTASMRAVETPKVGLYISIIALFLNISLNYIFIFGKLGLPARGVKGAAIATLLSRIVEMSFAVIYVLKVDKKLQLKPSDYLKINRTLLRDYVKYGIPVCGGSVVWSINMLAQAKIMGYYDASVIAAVSITGMLNSLVFMWTLGLSNAVGIITGKTVGAGEYEKMKQYAITVQVIFALIGLASGGIVMLACEPFISLYNVSNEAMAYTRQLASVLAITVMGQCYQAPCLGGLVKSGGDVSFVFKNDTIFVFLVVIPSALIAQRVFHAAPWVVFACLKSDQVLKCFVALPKINSFNWMKNLTRNQEEIAAGKA